ncbi:putative nucleotide-binding alpha-beta plait domain-containing protein [Rosa chinensis]|uniref:Putative nucleotide-binding alpha-beta plait domain-containing protein n=1 Tax=Rosa chinensis TaxID=74649 RepID=A0A2P6Q7C4_ROSCH|nr:organelle RRM domain-containing protein 6, chloroplastic isoform X2 [Rosa chinensis]PRQ30080.1 putative nucleotide-binding alpha-beta plait domain-containing protein [Rosa chinensis]
MWAAPVSFPSYNYGKPINTLQASGSNRRVPMSLKLRASFYDYPLASRIMVKNIPYSTSENSLQQKFSNFGEIAEVKLVKDETSKRSKGFAFIQYTSQDDAMLALENMDHQTFDGRVIYVELAKPGKDAYAGYPKTSGPPKKQYMQQQEEVTDCWY